MSLELAHQSFVADLVDLLPWLHTTIADECLLVGVQRTENAARFCKQAQ